MPQTGGHPYWTRKGDDLILNTGPINSHVISFTTTPRVGFGRPSDFPRLGRTESNPGSSRRMADAMPDGEHIIGVMIAGQSQSADMPAQITVVLNWFDEVRQRVR